MRAERTVENAKVITMHWAECFECDWTGNWCDTHAEAGVELDQHNAMFHGAAERQAGLA